MTYRLEVWRKGSDGKMTQLWRRRYRGLDVCFITRDRPPLWAETLIWKWRKP